MALKLGIDKDNSLILAVIVQAGSISAGHLLTVDKDIAQLVAGNLRGSELLALLAILNSAAIRSLAIIIRQVIFAFVLIGDKDLALKLLGKNKSNFLISVNIRSIIIN